MSAIPWTVVDPDTIERIIAVGLCRRHQHARRVKPSQGDGGLDVLVPISSASQLEVENYQVKKFADGLDASRKEQIKKSLKRAIATHKSDKFNYAISRWHLALPMDLTREQESWLFDLAEELEAPFPVEIFGLTAIEDLLLDYPNIREYYLGDGMHRVGEILAQLQSLTDIGDLAKDPAYAQPADATASLAELHQRINEVDPHFAYDYEVAADRPEMVAKPNRIASVVVRAEGPDQPFVTWHISTKYDMAIDDRPIPGSFTVHTDRMSEEQRMAWEHWRDYGTPVTLRGNVVEGLLLDLPGGLGDPLPAGEKMLKLGPAAGEFADERATRSLWVIEDAAGTRVAERMLSFRLEGRGIAGGEYRRGVDADGYISVDLFTKLSPGGDGTTGDLKAKLHMLADLWPGEPVQRVLPVIRFSAAWHDDHFLRPHDELGLTSADESFPLGGDALIPARVVNTVEDLARISTAVRKVITLPANIGALADRRGDAIRVVADAVCGLEPEVGIAEVELWFRDDPGVWEDLVKRADAGNLVVPWDIPFLLLGKDFSFELELAVTSSVSLELEEPAEGVLPGHGAAKLVVTESTRGRLRLRQSDSISA